MSEPKTTAIEIGGEQPTCRPRPAPARAQPVVFPGVTLPSPSAAPRRQPRSVGRQGGGFLIVATQRAPETKSPRLADLCPVGTLTGVVHWPRPAPGSRGVVGLARVRLTDQSEADGYSGSRRGAARSARPHPGPSRRRTVQRLGGGWWRCAATSPGGAQILDRFDDPARLADVIPTTARCRSPTRSAARPAGRARPPAPDALPDESASRRSRRLRGRAAGEIGEDERRSCASSCARSARAGRNDEQGGEGDELLGREGRPAQRSPRGRRARGEPAGQHARIPRALGRAPTSVAAHFRETDRRQPRPRPRARILDEDHFDLEKVKERILGIWRCASS